jgi:hypothetical protein
LRQIVKFHQCALEHQRGTLVPAARYVGMLQSNPGKQVEACLQKATECERRASLVADDTQRRTYMELARLWRDMAQQVEILHHQSSSLLRTATER